MLAGIHTTFFRLLHDRGNINPAEIDVRFDRPTREWSESLMRPTINMFLFEMSENTDRRSGAPQVSRGSNQAQFRVPPRHFDLYYLVSAFASSTEDEHTILWRALATLLRFSPLPSDLLPKQLAALETPFSTHIGGTEGLPRPIDLWGGFDLPPRPSVILKLIMPMDLEIEFNVPVVLSSSVRTSQRDNNAVEESPTRIGGTVRMADGTPAEGVTVDLVGTAESSITDEQGRYALRIFMPGTYTVTLTRRDGTASTATLSIPSASYDLVIEEP
ncbi:DUF4255 domain-containing protein [Chloroflexia bacterium SDU3-3]|nr:DUF4255 domain-containing protein [Chloroflexia bacterium SDU3-3]